MSALAAAWQLAAGLLSHLGADEFYREQRANSLLQLRFLLAIPPSSEAVFERFSDSAAAFVVLDPTNTSVYKQLYRAAKAKLKLRLRVTVKDKEPVMPKPATVEDEEPTPVSPVEEKAATPIVATTPATLAPQVAATPSTVEQTTFSGSVNELQGRFEDLLINHPRFTRPATLPVTPTRCTYNDYTPSKPVPRNMCTEIPVTRGAASRDRWFAELAAANDQRKLALRTNSAVPTPSTSISVFSVYCNNCSEPIPDEHYHCSTCDDGDFDLCQACVDNGVLCGGEDHWMIKRFVKSGKVINSTTETIAPKAIASVSKTTLVQPEEEEGVPTRTCNSCIQGKLENLYRV
jgi:next-to-BRCA1 protein 1